MTLQLVAIHAKGKQDEEYVELKAIEACNLKYYIVADTTYSSEATISNKLRHMYWFASKDVAKGDYVFLKTGQGKNTFHKNKAGTTTYAFFWGLKEPVWNNTGDAGILLTLEGWTTKKA